jgi:hypothetical protein
LQQAGGGRIVNVGALAAQKAGRAWAPMPPRRQASHA